MEAAATAVEAPATPEAEGTEALPQEGSSPEPKKETPQQVARRKYKIKVDGKEDEVELSDDDIQRDYQKWRSANQRFEQASQIYKKVQPLLNAREKGDLDQLLDGVPDDQRRKWAEQYLSKWIELQEMDPKEREALELKKENEQYKKKEEEQKKQAETAREKQVRQTLAKQAQTMIQDDIAEVLQDLPQDKRSPRLVARIADEMLTHFRAGKGKLPAKQAFERAQSNLETDVNQLLGSMDSEQLVQYLPKEVVNKVLKYHTEKVKSQSPFGASKASTPPKTRTAQSRMTTDDYFSKLDEKFRS